ncbi:hypothetical protein [Mucilaginibacter sp. SP1R1]|uniref:hypothetical protein n=1 Tax=Mucilaginibacter sp. SP1R1 TaxID=2723091 RepID=UPI00160D60AB|nr:hypothetical protein [Mucilaginibacter sp. SP1R1]MBB6149451.1 hypothetical protein [Mucilaginibacter sp. SP1R1]
MTIQLQEHEGLKLKNVLHEIISLNVISEPKSVLLVLNKDFIDTTDTENKLKPYKSIYKVQFIASAKTTICDREIRVAGFINDEYGNLDYWFIDLPGTTEQPNADAFLVDYLSYSEICSLTGIEPDSFSEYVDGYTSKEFHSFYGLS